MSAFQANDESSILSARTKELMLKGFFHEVFLFTLASLANNKIE